MRVNNHPFIVKARDNYIANKAKDKLITNKLCKTLSQVKYNPNDPELLRAKAKIEAVQNLIENGQLTPVPLSKEEQEKTKTPLQ